MNSGCPAAVRWGLALVAILTLAAVGRGESPPLAGYQDYARFQTAMRELGQSKLAELRSLGKTLGGREILLLEIGPGRRGEKPAVLLVGSVHAPQALGSELVVRVGRRLLDAAGRDPAVAQLLDRMTFYLLPRPSPDASEAQFARPSAERAGNARKTPPDRLGDDDLGGPADLNGDGVITLMRLADGSGTWMPHPTDPRVMIQADRTKGEQGRYKVFAEGRGGAARGEFQVGPAPGVAFNRNFPFKYAPFQPQVGPYPVSELETRAVAEFAFQRTNIAAVITIAPEDNLFNVWKPDAAAEGKPVKTTVLGDDAAVYQQAGKLYRDALGRSDAPDSAAAAGSFSQWAYFQYGRWSFACRGWWIPTLESGDKEKPKGDDRRGAEELNALRWLEREKIDGFVPWRKIEHPDLPHRTVEVGGFKPWVRLNPPAKELDGLADKHWAFVRRVAEQLPQVAIERVDVQPLGRGLYRVTATLVNQGKWPTASRMGALSRQLQRHQIELELRPEASLVTGVARQEVALLAGGGGRSEHVWLVRAAEQPDARDKIAPLTLHVRAWCPSIGQQRRAVTLAPTTGKEEQR